jgi:site-specific DNA-methyltransferase (adenine-specific)
MRLNYIDNMDCLEGLKQIPDASVDLVVTDPPYLISYATNRRKDKTHDFCSAIANDDNPELIRSCLSECYRVLKPDSAAYVFCSAKTLDTFKSFAMEAGFKVKNTIVWVKNNWTAGDLKAQYGQQYEPVLLLNKGRAEIRGKRLTDVWMFDRVAGKNQLHQNQKPVELIIQCIEKHSDPGQVVLDPFMGSGTTAVAAARTGRNYIGFELDEKYHASAMARVMAEVKEDEEMWMY